MHMCVVWSMCMLVHMWVQVHMHVCTLYMQVHSCVQVSSSAIHFTDEDRADQLNVKLTDWLV